jgi:hypothetical protein
LPVASVAPNPIPDIEAQLGQRTLDCPHHAAGLGSAASNSKPNQAPFQCARTMKDQCVHEKTLRQPSGSKLKTTFNLVNCRASRAYEGEKKTHRCVGNVQKRIVAARRRDAPFVSEEQRTTDHHPTSEPPLVHRGDIRAPTKPVRAEACGSVLLFFAKVEFERVHVGHRSHAHIPAHQPIQSLFRATHSHQPSARSRHKWIKRYLKLDSQKRPLLQFESSELPNCRNRRR